MQGWYWILLELCLDLHGTVFGIELFFAGADFDAIRTSYKRLANKWHPEKHPKSVEALKVTITHLLFAFMGSAMSFSFALGFCLLSPSVKRPCLWLCHA